MGKDTVVTHVHAVDTIRIGYNYYRVNELGIITSPGKFEGEMGYVAYFWDLKRQDTDDGTVMGFRVGDEDRKKFKGLKGSGEEPEQKWVFLREDDQGFVSEMTDGPRE